MAPDQRGIGDSTTWKQRARWWRFQPGTGQPDDADIQPLTVSNLAKDMTSLLDELGVQWLLSRVCLLLPSPCCIGGLGQVTSSALELVHHCRGNCPKSASACCVVAFAGWHEVEIPAHQSSCATPNTAPDATHHEAWYAGRVERLHNIGPRTHRHDTGRLALQCTAYSGRVTTKGTITASLRTHS